MNFDGIIREFPFICCDKFHSDASLFLLTHAHADHLTGLSNKSFFGEVLCSLETKQLLEKKDRYSKPARLTLTALPYNEPHKVEGYDITVTLVPANHCLGSTMFLIESRERNVLITGDCRCEQWWCDTLVRHPSLFPYISGLKKLDNIYLDSTFAYRGEPYIEIPPNNAGVYMAISMLKQYPRDDPELPFCFHDTTLGFEEAWAFILSFFRAALSVDANLQGMLNVVMAKDRTYGPILKQATKKYKDGKTKGGLFFAGTCPSENFVSIKQCINFNVMDLAGTCCPIQVDTIPKDEIPKMTRIKKTSKGTKIYHFRDRLWILPLGGKELLPQEIKLVFSRHSSYTETRKFVSLFTPNQVFPCVTSDRNYINGCTMKRLFGEICHADDFIYDKEQEARVGVPPPLVMNPVATINRWDPEECLQEKEVIRPALLDLRKVAHAQPFRKDRSAADNQFIDQRKKDFSFQKIVEGRREVTYKKFIEEQQMLYYKKHNLPQYERDYELEKYASRDFLSTLGGSSDYDTDSCSSGSDVLVPKKRQPSSEEKDGSVIAESQSFSQSQQNVHRIPGKKMQRSFVQSSFQSQEESYPKRRHTEDVLDKCKVSVLMQSERHPDQSIIDTLSRNFLTDPKAWQLQPLQCVRL